MFQPFWGAQHPTEPTFPNISAQSWYQPSVLSSLTETCYPPLPNNLIPAGPNSFQRAGDCTNTCPAPRPQSPFYSDLSPETRGLVFSLLAEKSEDELRTYLTDKDAYNKILHSIGEVKHMGHLRDDLCMKTTQLARKNIENATQIAELKNQCAIIRTTELAVAEEKFSELEKQGQELASLSPVVLLEKLGDAANIIDEESENLQHLIMSGEIELSDFIQNYKKMRRVYHTRTLLRLAAMASISA
ncbi:vacuolar protein-sorting-associated protein 37 homolog 2 isoform X1 [Cryptomeria japonica]|uniref:vacuolar protein-sorting-associated protein 37 homolog 2 isoform X1 n=1 Tax=Cryptomeria japonica TaxID=3369 RepID=UPI0027DA32C9|nr:vacuolar protein-sorting-associated protein 37 homolog 2 isoform X1 [Cryptomeria japonica]